MHCSYEANALSRNIEMFSQTQNESITPENVFHRLNCVLPLVYKLEENGEKITFESQKYHHISKVLLSYWY